MYPLEIGNRGIRNHRNHRILRRRNPLRVKNVFGKRFFIRKRRNGGGEGGSVSVYFPKGLTGRDYYISRIVCSAGGGRGEGIRDIKSNYT